MTIYYDKTRDKWKVDVWLKGRRYKSKTFDKKALAERFEREVLNEIDKLKLTGVQFQDLTYNELYDLWFQAKSYRKRKTSLVKDEQMHRDFVSPILGSLRVSEIRPLHFELIVGAILKKGLSKSSANKVIQHFKAVFNHSFKNETIARNPARSFEQITVDEKEMDYLYQDELQSFLSYTDRKYQGEHRDIHAFYLTLFLTGLRLGEALGLKWSDIDFSRDVIHMETQWSQLEQDFVDMTKGKKFRAIPLNATLKTELLRLRNNSRSDLVFTRDGVKPFDANNIRKRHWDKDFDAARVRRIRIHDARHTFGALFMMSGGNLYDLSKILGHASMATTERYAHLSNAHLSGVRNLIQVTIGQKPEAEVVSLPEKHSLPIHSQKKKVVRKKIVSD